MTKLSLGFIGFGNMATAIFDGLTKSHNTFSKVYVYEKAKKSLPKNIISTTHNDLIIKSDIIIIAVKPQQINDIKPFFENNDLSKKCLVSIMAGTTIKTLSKLNPTLTSIIRVMPNTAAQIQESISMLAKNKHCNKKFIDAVDNIFSSIGKTQIIDEAKMDIATALFGSGPAFIYQIMNELTKICIESGFTKKDSDILLKQLFYSTGKMALNSNKSTSQLIKEICSPNGTTEAGLNKFKELNIDIFLAQVIESAKNRSKSLSNE